ncbi:MAG: sterol desaturase family protein [Nitrospirota bacterium]|nr:sterol desaturase family protein [Nitrospirota bacterium]
MEALLQQYEATIRLVCFFGIFAAVALWELAAPRRAPSASKAMRWGNNIALVAVDTLLVRFLFGAIGVETAAMAAERGWGVLNNLPPLTLDPAQSVLAAVVVLDFIIYLQHVMFHAVPILWRLHRVHHADVDYDVTLGLRFHPVEIIISIGIKLAAIALVGAPVAAVVVFEIILNGMAMFNHGNIRLPLAVDRVLRLLFVTPDMHRVHHSVVVNEANSNFGFNLAIWDRLCGTYRAQPEAGHDAMTIGLSDFRAPKFLRLDWLLAIPFLGGTPGYPIGHAVRGGEGKG